MTASPPARAEGVATLPAGSAIYRAADLLRGADTARIVLDDRVYVLRLTRAGKLILTR